MVCPLGDVVIAAPVRVRQPTCETPCVIRATPLILAGRGLAIASIGQPDTHVGALCRELGISWQTLYRHVSPTGELRPDGQRLLVLGR